LGKAFFATFQILFYALRPMMVYQLPLTRIHAFNVVAQLFFDYLLVRFAGGNALWYLIMSSFLAGSLHPCAAHFIAEHYVFQRLTGSSPSTASTASSKLAPTPETFSYYGPLNILTYNVGLHNEHHDFPAIPWTRLPVLHSMAREFYEDLPRHRSWPYVIWQFIWDGDVGLWCRVKRAEGGRKVGGETWKEEELGANEEKGAIAGVR
jgi:sphingolipid delta-4 desaturase